MSEARRERRQRFHGRIAPEGARGCDAPDCREAGEFRAPRTTAGSSDEGGGRDWYWFCLDHVRAFNAAYNFFEGLTSDEIAAAQSAHPSWDRRTRAFATNAAAGDIDDPLGILRGRYGAQSFARAVRNDGKPIGQADRQALAALQLGDGATFIDIRRRYAELVRRYHPDANGGDRRHERRLQDVIDAYTHLKSAAAFAATV